MEKDGKRISLTVCDCEDKQEIICQSGETVMEALMHLNSEILKQSAGARDAAESVRSELRRKIFR